MRRTAAVGLGFAGLFLTVVAVLVGSVGLFYMSTAVLATLLASRIQAWFSVQKLTIRRQVPPTATVGELVLVEYEVQGTRRWRVPLITLHDQLPNRLHAERISPSLPVAPTSRAVMRSQYVFVPRSRGRFKWNGVLAKGMDAMGLSTISKFYPTDTAELLVYPHPEPIYYPLPLGSGFGAFEEGRSMAQSGIDPRGVRDYRVGDPLRHVHWRSTARSGHLQVKEFEEGAHSYAAILVQLDLHSAVNSGRRSSLDQIASHLAFTVEDMSRKGCLSFFPQFESISEISSSFERTQEMMAILAELKEEKDRTLGSELDAITTQYQSKCAYYVFASQLNPSIVAAIEGAARNQLAINLFWYPNDNEARLNQANSKKSWLTKVLAYFFDSGKRVESDPSDEVIETNRQLTALEDIGVTIIRVDKEIAI